MSSGSTRGIRFVVDGRPDDHVLLSGGHGRAYDEGQASLEGIFESLRQTPSLKIVWNVCRSISPSEALPGVGHVALLDTRCHSIIDDNAAITLVALAGNS